MSHVPLPVPCWSESMGTPLTPPVEGGFPACSSLINLIRVKRSKVGVNAS